MENTGRYNFLLYKVLSSLKLSVFIISSPHLKRSIDLTRKKMIILIAREYINLLRKTIWIFRNGLLTNSTIINKISYLKN